MGRPRFHPVGNTLAAIAVLGAMIMTVAAPAAATPRQKAWGDYDSDQQWHDANRSMQSQHYWVIVHHPEWTEDYAETPGQIGDSGRLHAWHYGDGGFDRHSNAVPTSAAKNDIGTTSMVLSTKPGASAKNASKLLENV
jgi:hypothetical protein